MSLENIYPIPLDQIEVSDQNVRVHNATTDIDELAASIKRHGLLQPIVLLGEYGKPPYQLICGQRRFLAHQKLNEASVRAVFTGKLSRTQAIVRSLVENLQKLDLEYVDAAHAITELYEQFGKDERKVQKETGLSIRTIRDYILIAAQATPKMKKLLKAQKVSTSDVKRALRAAQNNIRKAESLLDLIIKLNPTAHQKKRLVQYGAKDKDASAERLMEEAMNPHIEENIVISLPRELRDALTKATETLSMETEELATQILMDWLRDQGFCK